MSNDTTPTPAPALPQEVRKAIEDVLEAEYGRASSPVVTQSIFKAIAPHWPVPSDMNYLRQRLMESEERVENAVKLLAASEDTKRRLERERDQLRAELAVALTTLQLIVDKWDCRSELFISDEETAQNLADTARIALDAARNSCKRKSLRR